MTELTRNIIFLLSGLLGGLLFVLVKNKTTSQSTKNIQNLSEESKKSLIDLYNKGIVSIDVLVKNGLNVEKELNIKLPETFSGKKFVGGMFNLFSPVGWAKDISSILNIRKLIIIGLIIGAIYGFGWYRGIQTKPVHFDLHGKEALIQLNNHFLKIDKDGTARVIDKDGKILKTITVKDVDGLRQALKPYGFILEPIVVGGVGMGGSGAGLEGGAGISWFKWYKAKLDSFLTYKGIYPLGVSYSITDRSGIGLGVGKGFSKEDDFRTIIYYRWRF